MKTLLFIITCLLWPNLVIGQSYYYKEVALRHTLDSLFPDIKFENRHEYSFLITDSIVLEKTDSILNIIQRNYPNLDDLDGMYSMISANGFLDREEYIKALKYYYKAIAFFKPGGSYNYNISACFKSIGDIFLSIAKSVQPIPVDITIPQTKDLVVRKAIEYYNQAYKYFIMWRSEDKMPGLGIYINESEILFKKIEAYNEIAGKDYHRDSTIRSRIYRKKIHNNDLSNGTSKDRMMQIIDSNMSAGSLVSEIDSAFEVENYYNELQYSTNSTSEQKAFELRNQMQQNALHYEYEKKRRLAQSVQERQRLKYEEEIKRKQLTYDYAALLAAREKKDLIAKAAQDKERERQKQLQEQAQTSLRQQWLYSILILVALCLIAALFIFRNRIQRLKLRNELQKEKSDMQIKEAEYKSAMNDITFTALRAQMNPHFIFNCLNSIKLYTEQNNTEAASQYLSKFSRLIRNMLDSGRAESITLFQELESLRLYLEMEAMRFKQKLRYTISVDKDIDEEFIEIPPLLIQPYVENAIWHGLMHKEEGGMIFIDVSQSPDQNLLIITVKDDGIGREKAAAIKSESSVQHKSYGTKVTGERIALINEKYKAGAEAVITDLFDEGNEPAGTLVTIKIPIK